MDMWLSRNGHFLAAIMTVVVFSRQTCEGFTSPQPRLQSCRRAGYVKTDRFQLQELYASNRELEPDDP